MENILIFLRLILFIVTFLYACEKEESSTLFSYKGKCRLRDVINLYKKMEEV